MSKMTFKEFAGKKVRTEYGNINGYGIKLPVYERDIIEASLLDRGVPLFDLIEDRYKSLTCEELRAIAR